MHFLNRSLFFLLLTVGGLAVCPATFGFFPIRSGFAEVSPDGTRLLVLMGNHHGSKDELLITLPDGRLVDFGKHFAKPGIYNLSDFDLVSEFDFVFPSLNMLWNDDFSSIVVLNQYAAHFLGDWALGFVHEGKLIKTYECDELLTEMRETRRLPIKFPGGIFDWHDDKKFKKNGSRLTVATAPRRLFSRNPRSEIGFQEFYEFDFETGEMLSSRVENTKFKTIIVFIGILVALVIAICIWIGKILWKRSFRGSEST